MVKWIECPECGGLGSVNEHRTDSPRQAVIEAAKLWAAPTNHPLSVAHNLREAVRALQEVEGE